MKEEDISVTLTKKQWQSIISGEFNDAAGFDEGVVQTISEALCPIVHTPQISYRVRGLEEHLYLIAFSSCTVCFQSLWSITFRNPKERTYTYFDYLTKERRDFVVGDENDPQKIDIQAILDAGPTDHEWVLESPKVGKFQLTK